MTTKTSLDSLQLKIHADAMEQRLAVAIDMLEKIASGQTYNPGIYWDCVSQMKHVREEYRIDRGDFLPNGDDYDLGAPDPDAINERIRETMYSGMDDE